MQYNLTNFQSIGNARIPCHCFADISFYFVSFPYVLIITYILEQSTFDLFRFCLSIFFIEQVLKFCVKCYMLHMLFVRCCLNNIRT